MILVAGTFVTLGIVFCLIDGFLICKNYINNYSTDEEQFSQIELSELRAAEEDVKHMPVYGYNFWENLVYENKFKWVQ